MTVTNYLWIGAVQTGGRWIGAIQADNTGGGGTILPLLNHYMMG